VRATEAERDGSLLIHRKSFMVATETRRHVVDIRPLVEETIRSVGATNGIVIVNCLHTTCSILVAESAAEGTEHVLRLMGHVIRDDRPYRHNDVRWSDCERGNASAHLRASLLGPGITMALAGGRLALDEHQVILLAEWDGPRSRTVEIQILGS
jgi:secondary thiamine-phosphate synthase enzyme